MATGIRVIPARPRAVRRRRPTLSSSRELYGRSVQRSARATSCTAEASNAQLEPRAVRRKRPTLSSSHELYGGGVQRSAQATSCTAEASNAQLEPRAVRRKRPTLSSSRELYGGTVQRSARAASCTAEASGARCAGSSIWTLASRAASSSRIAYTPGMGTLRVTERFYRGDFSSLKSKRSDRDLPLGSWHSRP